MGRGCVCGLGLVHRLHAHVKMILIRSFFGGAEHRLMATGGELQACCSDRIVYVFIYFADRYCSWRGSAHSCILYLAAAYGAGMSSGQRE